MWFAADSNTTSSSLFIFPKWSKNHAKTLMEGKHFWSGLFSKIAPIPVSTLFQKATGEVWCWQLFVPACSDPWDRKLNAAVIFPAVGDSRLWRNHLSGTALSNWPCIQFGVQKRVILTCTFQVQKKICSQLRMLLSCKMTNLRSENIWRIREHQVVNGY